jgi:hypothetical protein
VRSACVVLRYKDVILPLADEAAAPEVDGVSFPSR